MNKNLSVNFISLSFWRFFPAFLFLCTLSPLSAAPSSCKLSSADVNPFIGTGGTGFGQGNVFLGAALPFGMVKAGPDTQGKLGRAGFAHTAGYWYADRFIEGFSQTHLHGTGAADAGAILITPTIGMDSSKTVEKGYRSFFSHKDEHSSPGYYSVLFKKSKLKAELTASSHVAFHRYTFPQQKEAVLIIDPTHALGNGYAKQAFIRIYPKQNLVEGSAVLAGEFVGEGGAYSVYFSAKLQQPFTSFGIWKRSKLFPNQQEGQIEKPKQKVGVYLSFDTSLHQPIEIQIGISFTSLRDARANLMAEGTKKTFETALQQARSQWSKLLGRLSLCGGSDKMRTIVTTALYHTALMPSLFTNTSRTYLGLDKKIHHAENFLYYTDFSLWDTYRTLHPLLTLLYPEYQTDFLRSLAAMLDQLGYLPRWPLASKETGSMVGSPASIVIADSVLKGLKDFPLKKVYAGMKAQATKEGLGRSGLRYCLQYHYCPSDKVGGSVSRTQEYAYADFALSQVARALGRKKDAKLFRQRARAYQNLWDPKQKFFRPKTTQGSWAKEAFLPEGILQPHYVEGNAWQYLFFVPYDPQGLITLFGSREALLEKLNLFFSLSQSHPAKPLGKGKSTIQMPDPYYWHGNEPDIHTAYLFPLLGSYPQAPPILRWIVKTRYNDKPNGLNGNDDGGTLSAWLVFTALGFYPIAGTDIYLLGTPFFPKATLSLSKNSLTILAPEASSKKIYIQSAKLNGIPLKKPWLHHAQLTRGGVLYLKMGSSPSKWGETSPLSIW